MIKHFQELVSYRDLLWLWTLRQVRVRYKQWLSLRSSYRSGPSIASYLERDLGDYHLVLRRLLCI